LSAERLQQLAQNKYTIASWVWEMPEVPELWRSQFARVSEVWVPSTFTRGIFMRVTDSPVNTVPHPIDVRVSEGIGRSAFGLPEDRTIFLFSFSAGSGDGRKNPWGIIDAFKRAFGKSAQGGPLLVMKVQHSQDYKDLTKALADALDGVDGLIL